MAPPPRDDGNSDLKSTKTVSIRLCDEDQEALRVLRHRTGIQNTTDMIRLSLREAWRKLKDP